MTHLSYERSMIYAVLLRLSLLSQVRSRINSEMIFDPVVRAIYDAMKSLNDKGVQIDAHALIDIASSQADIARAAVLDFFATPAWHINSYGIEIYIQGVIDKWNTIRTKQLVSAAMDGIDQTPIDSQREVLGHLHNSLVKMQSKEDVSVVGLNQDLASLEPRGKEKTVHTKIIDIDDMLNGGIAGGQLMIVAAGTSIGKSAFAYHMAVNCWNYREEKIRPSRVLVVSLEVNRKSAWLRMIANLASLNLADIVKYQNGEMSEQLWVNGYKTRFDEARDTLAAMPVSMFYTGRITARGIHAQIQRMKDILDLVIVDYLQLVEPDERTQNRVEALGQVSRTLKRAALEFNIPVVALCQINREGAKGGERGGQKPQLWHLRGSGDIEQDADIVGLMWRDRENCNLTADVEFNIAKNRDGKTGIIDLKMSMMTGRFR